MPPPPPPPASERIPSFPWPPPQASASQVISNELLVSKTGDTYLRDVDARLTKVLDDNGYSERSYFSVPDGYAAVTRIEQIGNDGASMKDPQRWSLAISRINEFSFSAYLKALFQAQPGYYRVIVFIVTSREFSQSKRPVSSEEALEWLREGVNKLPNSIGSIKYSPQYACTALIYEFERPSESSNPAIRVPGRLNGQVHLNQSGLLGGFKR